jgi:hypothetical protein
MNRLHLLASLLFFVISLQVMPVIAKTPLTPDKLSTWEPNEHDKVQVPLQSYAYFRAKDRGDYIAAFGTYAAVSSKKMDFSKWKSEQAGFRKLAGSDLSRKITRVTWFPSVDPSQAGSVLVAANFSAQSKTLAVHCGRLLWQRLADGRFDLIQEESGFLTQQAAKTMSADALKQRRNQLGCIGND